MDKYSIVGYLPSGAPFDSLLVSGKGAQKTVSYTHLTLPTIYSV